MLVKLIRTLVLAIVMLWAAGVSSAIAQTTSPFVFTVTTPEPTLAVGGSQPTVTIGDRALTLWTGRERSRYRC